MIAYLTLVLEATGFVFNIVLEKMRFCIEPIYKIELESNDPTDHVF